MAARTPLKAPLPDAQATGRHLWCRAGRYRQGHSLREGQSPYSGRDQRGTTKRLAVGDSSQDRAPPSASRSRNTPIPRAERSGAESARLSFRLSSAASSWEYLAWTTDRKRKPISGCARRVVSHPCGLKPLSVHTTTNRQTLQLSHQRGRHRSNHRDHRAGGWIQASPI